MAKKNCIDATVDSKYQRQAMIVEWRGKAGSYFSILKVLFLPACIICHIRYYPNVGIWITRSGSNTTWIYCFYDQSVHCILPSKELSNILYSAECWAKSTFRVREYNSATKCCCEVLWYKTYLELENVFDHSSISRLFQVAIILGLFQVAIILSLFQVAVKK